MNAQFEKKSTKDFNRTIGNMTAQFDKGKDNIKDKTYGGFWARMDRASDNVSNGDKYLSGVTAEVNKLTKAAGTVLELAGTIVTGGGGVKIKLASGGLYKNGQWQPVTAAASGGAFSTGQMFIAREAGPELVGRIGRSTAVMNNNQIVSSVASGVYSRYLRHEPVFQQGFRLRYAGIQYLCWRQEDHGCSDRGSQPADQCDRILPNSNIRSDIKHE